MAKFKIKEPTTEKFEELVMISHNLRFYIIIWQEHFGSYNRSNMRYWEQRMDNWLKNNTEQVGDEEIEYSFTSSNNNK